MQVIAASEYAVTGAAVGNVNVIQVLQGHDYRGSTLRRPQMVRSNTGTHKGHLPRALAMVATKAEMSKKPEMVSMGVSYRFPRPPGLAL